MSFSIGNLFGMGPSALEDDYSSKQDRSQNAQENREKQARLDEANSEAFQTTDGLMTESRGEQNRFNKQLASRQDGHALLNFQISRNQAAKSPAQFSSGFGVGGNIQSSNYTPSNNATAESIAKSAQKTAHQMGSTGLCYRGVKKGLSQNGIHLTGGSAYMAANQLAKSNEFVEVKPGDTQRGDILVHNRTSRKKHGHIAVALGNGKEASDHVGNLVNTASYGGTRVFRAKGPPTGNFESNGASANV